MIRGLISIAPRGVCCLAVLALGLASICIPAHADEIIVRDLDTGAKSSINVWGVTSESWSEVKYKERERSAEKSVPTLTVVEINRSSDKSANAQALRAAIAELERGHHREAADAFQAINGGGTKLDLETGERKFVSFSENDPSGRNKRPSWISEYSHFYYAKAKYLQGAKNNDRAALEEAVLALDDVKAPSGEGKTGGFLGRFANGNSRFFAEAMMLKANALARLKRYDEAKATFAELDAEAIKVPLEPRWLYEGAIGPGVIAEDKGDLKAATAAYNAASNKMWVMLGKEQRRWLLAEVGRYISRATMRTTAAMLSEAEKSGDAGDFRQLSAHIAGTSPDALRKKAQGRGLGGAAVNAVVAGARDPAVQAVGLTGEGLASLNASKPNYEEALLAFKGVTVKYFEEPEQHARALYYLAKAADGAAKGAKGDARTMYNAMAKEATRMLRDQHPDSPWAQK